MVHPSAPPCPPVALIVFNRPDCTAKVLAAIRREKPPRLFVIADGPRLARPDDRENCRIVRKLVDDSVDWDCEVTRLYSGTNMGCAARVSSGLEAVFEAVEEAIILEDDCVPAPEFFRFCAELLDRYRDDTRVGMIAGTNFRGATPAGPESYLFSTHYSVWGWATWRRAFSGFDLSMAAWRTTVHPADIAENWTHGRTRMLHTVMFDVCREAQIDTWCLPWCFHLAARRQVSAVAGVNLITNIGVDGAHTRQASRNNFLPAGELTFPLVHPPVVAPDRDYDRIVAGRHRLYRDWLRVLWAARIRRILGRNR